MTRAASSLLALACLVAPATVAAQPQSPEPEPEPEPESGHQLTLAQAVAAALSDNPELAIAARSIDVAGSRVRSARAQRLPKLSVSANVLVWDGPIVIEFTNPMAPPDTPAPSITARDQVTAQAAVTLAQPLSALAALARLIGIEETGRDLARTELSGARLDVGARAAELYLRGLQARAGVEIAERTLTQLDAQIQRAKVLETSGVLTRVDVMRLESARSAAAQQLLAARDAAAGAGDALALVLGLAPGTQLRPVDDLPAQMPPPRWKPADALALAAERRTELRAAALRARQADGAIDLQRANLFPSVNAIANYSHTEGQGAFAEPDAFYVGLTLSWDVWDWGKRSADIAEARGRATQARMAATRQRDQVALDVRAKARAAHTTWEQLAVSAQGLATAEEAYRLVTVRYESGAATTLDVLDAEVDVARARLASANYRYEYAVALIQLARAVGEQPLAALEPR
jgi:outer membrane protein